MEESLGEWAPGDSSIDNSFRHGIRGADKTNNPKPIFVVEEKRHNNVKLDAIPHMKILGLSGTGSRDFSQKQIIQRNIQAQKLSKQPKRPKTTPKQEKREKSSLEEKKSRQSKAGDKLGSPESKFTLSGLDVSNSVSKLNKTGKMSQGDPTSSQNIPNSDPKHSKHPKNQKSGENDQAFNLLQKLQSDEFQVASWIEELFEDPSKSKRDILDTRINRKIRKFEGHQKCVNNLQFNAKETRMYSVSSDKTLKIWDLASGTLLKAFRARNSPFTSLAISHNNQLLAAGGQDRCIRIYNLELERCIKVLKKNASPVKTLAFTKDDNFLLTGFKGKVRVYDMKQFSIVIESSGHDRTLNKIIFSKSGRHFLTCGNDKKILVWDSETFLVLRKLKQHESKVTDLILGEKDTKMISSGEDGVINIWNMANLEPDHTFQAHKLAVNCLCLKKGGQFLFSGSEDKTIKLWDLETMECLQVFRHHKNSVFKVRLSSDGTQLFSSGWEKVIYQLDLQDSQSRLPALKHPSTVVLKLCVNKQNDELITGCHNGSISIWDPDCQNDPKFELKGHRRPISCLETDRSGRYLYSGSEDGYVICWNLITKEEVTRLDSGDSKITALALHEDKRLLLVADGSRHISVWSMDSYQLVAEMQGQASKITSILITTQSLFLAADRFVRIFDAKSLTFTQALLNCKSEVTCLAYHPDTKTLFSAGKNPCIKVWDIRSEVNVAELPGHAGQVFSLLLIQELNVLVSSGSDRTVRLWDHQVYSLVHVVNCSDSEIISLAYCMRSNTICCAAGKGDVHRVKMSAVARIEDLDHICLLKLRQFYLSGDDYSREQALMELVNHLKKFPDVFVLYNFDLITLLIFFEFKKPLFEALRTYGYPLVKNSAQDPLNLVISDPRACSMHVETLADYLSRSNDSIKLNPRTLEALLTQTASQSMKSFLCRSLAKTVITQEGDLKALYYVFETRSPHNVAELQEQVMKKGSEEVYMVSFKRTNYRICLENGTRGSLLLLKFLASCSKKFLRSDFEHVLNYKHKRLRPWIAVYSLLNLILAILALICCFEIHAQPLFAGYLGLSLILFVTHLLMMANNTKFFVKNFYLAGNFCIGFFNSVIFGLQLSGNQEFLMGRILPILRIFVLLSACVQIIMSLSIFDEGFRVLYFFYRLIWKLKAKLLINALLIELFSFILNASLLKIEPGLNNFSKMVSSRFNYYEILYTTGAGSSTPETTSPTANSSSNQASDRNLGGLGPAPKFYILTTIGLAIVVFLASLFSQAMETYEWVAREVRFLRLKFKILLMISFDNLLHFSSSKDLFVKIKAKSVQKSSEKNLGSGRRSRNQIEHIETNRGLLTTSPDVEGITKASHSFKNSISQKRGNQCQKFQPQNLKYYKWYVIVHKTRLEPTQFSHNRTKTHFSDISPETEIKRQAFNLRKLDLKAFGTSVKGENSERGGALTSSAAHSYSVGLTTVEGYANSIGSDIGIRSKRSSMRSSVGSSSSLQGGSRRSSRRGSKKPRVSFSSMER